jgi:DNA-binding beta-propeller fold protein YncE
MPSPVKAAVAAATLSAALIVLAAPAGASSNREAHAAENAVFVQTDNPVANKIISYHRWSNGRLTFAHAYFTGGRGGVLAGSVVDHLASQGSLTYDGARGLLFAVNAGSDTVSLFEAHGDRLTRLQIVGSGGRFPVSIAVRGDFVFVLNALRGGSVQGFRLTGDDRLQSVRGWNRPLGLDPKATPQFTNTPGDIAFSPSGSQLIVTTKANGNHIDVFRLAESGRPSSSPVVNTEAGAVPFAVSFDEHGRILVTNAGPSTVSSFQLRPGGKLVPISTVATGQSAACWLTRVGDRPLFLSSNAGSADLTEVRSGQVGSLAVRGTFSTDPGPVDSATARHGRFFYVQTGGKGIVDEFKVQSGGRLSRIGAVEVPRSVGGEGLVAI